jgi:hypothetical protein
MIDCPNDDLLAAFIEETLDDTLDGAIRRHLTACAACAVITRAAAGDHCRQLLAASHQPVPTARTSFKDALRGRVDYPRSIQARLVSVLAGMRRNKLPR